MMVNTDKNIDGHNSDKHQQIQAQLEETRRSFHALLDRLTNEDLNRPSLNPAWSIREVLYHMTLAPGYLPSDVWLIKHLRWVPKIPAGPFNRLNTYLTRRGGQNASKEKIASAYNRAHQRALKALDTIQDSDWDRSVDYPDWDPMLSGSVSLERLFQYLSMHFKAHAKEIEAVLESIDVSGAGQ